MVNFVQIEHMREGLPSGNTPIDACESMPEIWDSTNFSYLKNFVEVLDRFRFNLDALEPLPLQFLCHLHSVVNLSFKHAQVHAGTGARVGPSGEETVGEFIHAYRQVCLWEWLPLLAQIHAVTADHGERKNKGRIESCRSE